MKNFFEKLKTNFTFRKKVIITAVIVLLVLCGITLIKVNGSSLFASVIMMTRPATDVNAIKCVDSDGGLNYFVKGTTKGFLVNNNQYVQKTDSCRLGLGTDWLVEYACNANKRVYEDTYLCPGGCDDANGVCLPGGQGTGYGYGYGYGGQGTGYGYGYGYMKLDLTKGQPYIYLTHVLAKYSKTVYDNVIARIGFQIVKFYNKKEFGPMPTTK